MLEKGGTNAFSGFEINDWELLWVRNILLDFLGVKDFGKDSLKVFYAFRRIDFFFFSYSGLLNFSWFSLSLAGLFQALVDLIHTPFPRSLKYC